MALEVGNLFNAAGSLVSTISDNNVKAFLANINNFGVQVKNNFEVNFSEIPDVKIFVQQITLPDITVNYAELNFNGRKVEIPVNYDFSHDFSMTMLNDAQGYIYTELLKFIKKEAFNVNANTGYTMRIRVLTGDELNYGGNFIVLHGVRINNISALDYGYDQSDIQTFTISGKCTHFEVTPGAIGEAANILGSLNGIV